MALERRENGSAMTSETDVKLKIAALNRVLADATVECTVLWCEQAGGQTFLYEGLILEGCLPCKRHPTDCICQGAGRVARFPGFRQGPGVGLRNNWTGDT